jgi:hypothetical protein
VQSLFVWARSIHGKMEVRGIIAVAYFLGTIVRQVGKDLFSEKVALRRKPENDLCIGTLFDGIISSRTSISSRTKPSFLGLQTPWRFTKFTITGAGMTSDSSWAPRRSSEGVEPEAVVNGKARR